MSQISEVTVYGLGGFGLIPDRCMDFLFTTVSRVTGVHPATYSVGLETFTWM